MRIAITGKIGSGKSSLARSLFARLEPQGYALLDVDALTDAVRQDPAFQAQEMALFGTHDRAEISQRCFSDPALLDALERASLPCWLGLVELGLAPAKLIVDFPLLIESEVACPVIDLCVGVSAPRADREARAMARLGWDAQRFAAADARQINQRAKMSFCDQEASNEGSPEALEAHAERLARNIRALDEIEPTCLPVIGPLAFRQIQRAYAEPHRRYHDATHLASLLFSIEPSLRSDPACVMAIAYHDFVYETGEAYALNESRSARALSAHARDLFPERLGAPGSAGFGAVALACAMIDATKGHAIDDPWILSDPARLWRAQCFLDADLGILGSSRDSDFERYDKEIGEEFSGVARPLYHQLRAKAMAHFADPALRPRLYFTERFGLWDEVAHSRLASLVERHRALGEQPPQTAKESP